MLDSGLPIGRCIWTRQGEWWGSAFLGFTLIVSVLQVDSWALGVLLYTLVYGTMPFDGFDHKNLIRQISSGEYREPTQTSGIKKEWGQCIELTGVQNGRFAPCLLEYFGVMLEWHRKKNLSFPYWLHLLSIPIWVQHLPKALLKWKFYSR